MRADLGFGRWNGVGLAFLIALTAGCGGADGSGSRDDADLIGGTPAELMPPGLVALNVECGAVKVGPRDFLTAGHCVVRRFGDLDFETGEPTSTFARGAATCIYPSLRAAWNAPCSRPLHIVWTKVHPTFQEHVRTSDPRVPSSDANDLAILRVDADTPEIAVATLDEAPVAIGESIIMTGYGCTTPPSPGVAPPMTSERVLRAAFAWVAGLDDRVFLTAAGSPVAGCPGDSGAPVYRARADGGYDVIGINNFLRPDLVTGMARLDRAERAGGRWVHETLQRR